MNRSVSTKKMVVVAMLSAIAYLTMFVFRIKVDFLTFDAKDAVLAMVSLLYGPLWGMVSAVIVPLLEMITVSDTGVYGFIMNTLSSVTFTLICGGIYQYKRKLSGAVVGVVAAALVTTGVMLLANLVITPYYMGVKTTQVVALIPIVLLPFNLIKSILNAAIVLAIYKPFTSALKQTGLLPHSKEKYHMSKRSALLLMAAILVVILSIVAFLIFMNGTFEIIRQI